MFKKGVLSVAAFLAMVAIVGSANVSEATPKPHSTQSALQQVAQSSSEISGRKLFLTDHEWHVLGDYNTTAEARAAINLFLNLVGNVAIVTRIILHIGRTGRPERRAEWKVA